MERIAAVQPDLELKVSTDGVVKMLSNLRAGLLDTRIADLQLPDARNATVSVRRVLEAPEVRKRIAELKLEQRVELGLTHCRRRRLRWFHRSREPSRRYGRRRAGCYCQGRQWQARVDLSGERVRPAPDVRDLLRGAVTRCVRGLIFTAMLIIDTVAAAAAPTPAASQYCLRPGSGRPWQLLSGIARPCGMSAPQNATQKAGGSPEGPAPLPPVA